MTMYLLEMSSLSDQSFSGQCFSIFNLVLLQQVINGLKQMLLFKMFLMQDSLIGPCRDCKDFKPMTWSTFSKDIPLVKLPIFNITSFCISQVLVWWLRETHCQIVSNKAKGRISKPVFQENKASQIFPKTNISCTLIRTRTFWDSPFCFITDEISHDQFTWAA